MSERVSGRSAAAHNLINLYQSGFCGSGSHDRCRGLYAGIVCHCPHHTAEPPTAEPVELCAMAPYQTGAAS